MYFNTLKEYVTLFLLFVSAMCTYSIQIASRAYCAVHTRHRSQCPPSPPHEGACSQNKHDGQKVWRETANTELKCPCLQPGSSSAAGDMLMRIPPRRTLAQLHQELFPGLNPLLKLGSQVFSSKPNNPPSFFLQDGLEGLSTSTQ